MDQRIFYPQVSHSIGGNTSGALADVVSGTYVLAGGNNITLSQNGNSVTISGAAGGGGIAAAAGTQTGTSGTVAFVNSNGLTFGMSGSTQITASYTVPSTAGLISAINLSAGTTSNNLSAFTFNNANGVSFGLNASTLTASHNGLTTQTNQQMSLYAQSNTTQSSSGTMNASSIQFAGAGIASVGVSNGSVIISVPSGGGAGDGVNIIAAGTQTAATTGTVMFSNSNGVSFGMSNSSIVTVSFDPINIGVSTMGNTAGTTGTIDGKAAEFLFVGSSGITLSQSINGQSVTLTFKGPGDDAIVRYFEPPVRGATSSQSLSNGTVYFQPFVVEEQVSMYRLHMENVLTTQATTTMSVSGSVSAGNASSGTGRWGQTGTVMLFSRVSTGTAANSSQIVSFYSNSYSYQINLNESVSWSTNASSATVSYTTSGEISFISSIDSLGGKTTGSFGLTGSASFSSTSTNANSFSSSTVMSFASAVMSGIRPLMVPFATSLTPGEYWLAHIQSSSSASTNYSLQRLVTLAPGILFYTSNTSGYAEIGSTATIASSNVMPGWGSYSASSQTSTTIPLSQISNQSQFQTWFNMMAAVK